MPPHQGSSLFLISADPLRSPRAVEALRVAAGVSAWDEIRIRVMLSGPARSLLEADAPFEEAARVPGYLETLVARTGSILVDPMPAGQARLPVPLEVVAPLRRGSLLSEFAVVTRWGDPEPAGPPTAVPLDGVAVPSGLHVVVSNAGASEFAAILETTSPPGPDTARGTGTLCDLRSAPDYGALLDGLFLQEHLTVW